MTAVQGATAFAVPEVVVGGPYASWGRRVAATVLDDGLLAALAWVSAPEVIRGPFTGPTLAPAFGSTGYVGSGGLLALVALLAMQAYLGATPGKLALGLVVVRMDDSAYLGLWRTVLRALLHLLDAILSIGYLRPLWHDRRQTFADSIVRSVVVARIPRQGWRRPAGIVSGVVCVLVALGGLPVSFSSPMVTASCVLEPEPGVAAVRSSASLTYEPGWQTERRLGLSKRVVQPGEARLAAVLDQADALPDGAELRLEVTDETGAVSTASSSDSPDLSGDLTTPSDTPGVALPLADGAPAVTSWRVEVVVGGVVTHTCVGSTR